MIKKTKWVEENYISCQDKLPDVVDIYKYVDYFNIVNTKNTKVKIHEYNLKEKDYDKISLNSSTSKDNKKDKKKGIREHMLTDEYENLLVNFKAWRYLENNKTKEILKVKREEIKNVDNKDKSRFINKLKLDCILNDEDIEDSSLNFVYKQIHKKDYNDFYGLDKIKEKDKKQKNVKDDFHNDKDKISKLEYEVKEEDLNINWLDTSFENVKNMFKLYNIRRRKSLRKFISSETKYGMSEKDFKIYYDKVFVENLDISNFKFNTKFFKYLIFIKDFEKNLKSYSLKNINKSMSWCQNYFVLQNPKMYTVFKRPLMINHHDSRLLKSKILKREYKKFSKVNRTRIKRELKAKMSPENVTLNWEKEIFRQFSEEFDIHNNIVKDNYEYHKNNNEKKCILIYIKNCSYIL